MSIEALAARTEIRSNGVEGRRKAVDISMALLSSEARRAQALLGDEKPNNGSPEDMKASLTIIMDYPGGKGGDGKCRYIPLSESDQGGTMKVPEVTYKIDGGVVVLGLVPENGVLPDGTAKVKIDSIVDRTPDGGYVISFSGTSADGAPLMPAIIPRQDFLIIYASTYQAELTAGMAPDTSGVVDDTFSHLRGNQKLPDAQKVERASAFAPTVKRFESGSKLISNLSKQEGERVAQRRADIRNNIDIEVAAKDNNPTRPKTEAEIDAEVTDVLGKEGASPTAALIKNLTTETIQNPEDLAEAFRMLSVDAIDRQIAKLNERYGEANTSLNEAQARANSTTGPMKENFQKEMEKWQSVRQAVTQELEILRNFKERKDDVAKQFFQKSQGGELPRDVISNVQDAMKEGNVDEVINIMARHSGIDLKDPKIAGLIEGDSKKKELITKLLEIGGPILYLVLQMLIDEMRRASR